MKYKWIWVGISSIFVIVGLALAYFGLQDLTQARYSTGWRPADGVIVSSDLRVRTDEEGDTLYSADVRYTYAVNGQELTGDRIFFGQMSTSDRRQIFDLLLKYEQGQVVTVYFNPDDPTQAVLEPGVHGATWFLPALGGGFAILGSIFVLIGLLVNFDRFSV